MIKLVQQLEHYLREILGIPVAPHTWEKSRGLPQYLRERYRFFRMEMLETECILMADTDEDEQTPTVIRKHIDQIRARHDAKIVYMRKAVTSYNRKRLIEQKVPFIVPGNQMYIPMLGIDLREHLRRIQEKKPLFSPSTQALILYILWQKERKTVMPAEIAQRIGYSAMTMTRAFDELEAAGIGEHTNLGKERHLRFAETGKILWEMVLPYLNTPVRKHLYADSSLWRGKGYLAGLSALARYTILAESKIPVFAISAEEWKRQKLQEKNLERPMPEPGVAEIELWKYHPAPIAHGGLVDRLSLYLSLKDSTDERIQSALESLLGDMKW